MNGHEVLWLCQRRKAESGIKPVSVTGREQQASQSLKIGMRKNRSHQQLGNTAPAMLRNHKNVANVGHRRKVGRDAGKPNLASAMKGCKSQGVLNGTFDDAPR